MNIEVNISFKKLIGKSISKKYTIDLDLDISYDEIAKSYHLNTIQDFSKIKECIGFKCILSDYNPYLGYPKEKLVLYMDYILQCDKAYKSILRQDKIKRILE